MTEERRLATLEAVRAIEPVDERERASQVEVLAALESLARPFDEHAHPTHVTGSALIAGPRGIVLLKHKRLGLWLQPGGHVDGVEHPSEAALREAHEETGLDLAHPPTGPLLLHVDAHDGGRGHRHLDLRYVLLAGEDDPRPPEGESQECAWFDWDAAAALADPGLRGALPRLRHAI